MPELTVELSAEEEMVHRHIERDLAEKDAHRTTVNQSWDNLCRVRFNIPFELKDLYRAWLLSLPNSKGKPRFQADDLPTERGAFVKPGLVVPPPYGEEWEKLIEGRSDKWKSKYYAAEAAVEERNELDRMHYIMHVTLSSLRNEGFFDELHEAFDTALHEGVSGSAMAAKKKRRKAYDHAHEGKPPPPSSIKNAIHHEDINEAMRWVGSLNTEWDGLNELGVFEHDFTLQMLTDRGVTNTPIPFSICLDYKYDMAGIISRYKSRFAMAGHPGNMQKGIHYDRTFAATPKDHTGCILQALLVKRKMRRRAWDIKQAYCHAKLDECEFLAVRYPPGFEHYHPVTGEPLYLLLVRNLYGHPAAGRNWEKERNIRVMQEFNKGLWRCKQCVKDPCLFTMQFLGSHAAMKEEMDRALAAREDKKKAVTWADGSAAAEMEQIEVDYDMDEADEIDTGANKALSLIHTDDVDCLADTDDTTMAVMTKFENLWPCKEVDASYMLGVKRIVTEHDDGSWSVELTMTAFIEGMAATFKKYITKRTVRTPIPDHFFVSKNQQPDLNEIKNVMERGYQRLFGMLLWAARGVFRDCLVGTSMMGRVVATPTEYAWSGAVHMLNFMYQNKLKGIMFNSGGSLAPYFTVDASNKPDPTDSKCQYGLVGHWQGGPIISVSRKLSHVGLSAAHNEYMAIHWAVRHCQWMRDLLREMGFAEYVEEPTLIFGDNRAANLLCEEDIVTLGNQFIRLPFHYTKEQIRARECMVRWIGTDENTADLMTKASSRQVYEKLAPRLLGYASIERARQP